MSDEKGIAATPEEYKWEFIKGRLIGHSNDIKKLNKVVGDHETSIRYQEGLNRRAWSDLDTLKHAANNHDRKLNYLRGEYRKLMTFAVVNAALTLILAIMVHFK